MNLNSCEKPLAYEDSWKMKTTKKSVWPHRLFFMLHPSHWTSKIEHKLLAVRSED